MAIPHNDNDAVHIDLIRVVDGEFMRRTNARHYDDRLNAFSTDMGKPYGIVIMFPQVDDPRHPPEEVLASMKRIHALLKDYKQLAISDAGNSIEWNIDGAHPVLTYEANSAIVDTLLDAGLIKEHSARILRFDVREATGANPRIGSGMTL
jgi:hypothetical protein